MCKYLFLLRLIYRHLSSFGYTILSRLGIGSGYRKAGKDENLSPPSFFGCKSKDFAACGVHFDILSETGLR